ncbi:penicillin-binding protein 1A [Granulicella cerasi]|uniref:peptidoglycan glycosyltransferase n=2 Tax=Granulicella cerasi TaxID=741063 RepID=A0ABW1Z7N8_9BACT
MPAETPVTKGALWRAMRSFPFKEPEFRSRKIAAKASFWLLIGASAVFGIMVGLMLTYSVNLPQMADLERYRPSTTTELLDVHGRVFGSFALERRVVVPYSEFPPVLRDAILSIEDKNFMSNSGVNLIRVVGAAWKDLHSKQRSQGASTLTMQLARNLFLSSEKTYGRKLQEIFLTLQIERHFTKAQIFSLYANQIYLGRGTYGFEAGSEYYFSKHARDLTLAEAATLAGLPKGPEEYSPVRHPERALRRRNLVLAEMYEDKRITAAQYSEAKRQPLGLNLEPPPSASEAPYFIEEVRRQLEREYGAEEVHGAGLKVYTTLDLDAQRAANKALLDDLAAYERRRGWKSKLQNVLTSGADLNSYKHPDWNTPIAVGTYFHALVMEVAPTRMVVRVGRVQSTMEPADWVWTQKLKATEIAKPGDIVYVKVATAGATPRFLLEQDSGAQGAFMAVNNANGEVMAMIGGRDFEVSQFNRATQAQRQTGSSFKPYDYTAAMEAGMKPTDTVLDAPASFYTPNGPYTPHNYEADWRGPMSLTEAFAESRNIPALRLADKVGIRKVIEVARRFGVTSPLPNFLPVAIGAAGITLSEQVASYSVFPNDGIRIQPHYIRRIVQADGLPLEQKTPEVKEVITVDIARKMMVLLEAVTSHGTAATVSQMHHAFGGKTGTTNSFTDAWFLGFSPSVTAGVWVGFDNPSQTLGDKETGARAALPAWIDFMKVATASVPNEQFARYDAPKKQLDVQVTPNATSAPAAPKKPAEADDDSDDSDDDTPKPAAPAKVTAAPAVSASESDDGHPTPVVKWNTMPAAAKPATGAARPVVKAPVAAGPPKSGAKQ